jgi:hypothetical protein
MFVDLAVIVSILFFTKVLFANVIAALARINTVLFLSLTNPHLLIALIPITVSSHSYPHIFPCSLHLLSLRLRESPLSSRSVGLDFAVPPAVLSIMGSLQNALNAITSGGKKFWTIF